MRLRRCSNSYDTCARPAVSHSRCRWVATWLRRRDIRCWRPDACRGLARSLIKSPGPTIGAACHPPPHAPGPHLMRADGRHRGRVRMHRRHEHVRAGRQPVARRGRRRRPERRRADRGERRRRRQAGRQAQRRVGHLRPPGAQKRVSWTRCVHRPRTAAHRARARLPLCSLLSGCASRQRPRRPPVPRDPVHGAHAANTQSPKHAMHACEPVQSLDLPRASARWCRCPNALLWFRGQQPPSPPCLGAWRRGARAPPPTPGRRRHPSGAAARRGAAAWPCRRGRARAAGPRRRSRWRLPAAPGSARMADCRSSRPPRRGGPLCGMSLLPGAQARRRGARRGALAAPAGASRHAVRPRACSAAPGRTALHGSQQEGYAQAPASAQLHQVPRRSRTAAPFCSTAWHHKLYDHRVLGRELPGAAHPSARTCALSAPG